MYFPPQILTTFTPVWPRMGHLLQCFVFLLVPQLAGRCITLLLVWGRKMVHRRIIYCFSRQEAAWPWDEFSACLRACVSAWPCVFVAGWMGGVGAGDGCLWIEIYGRDVRFGVVSMIWFQVEWFVLVCLLCDSSRSVSLIFFCYFKIFLAVILCSAFRRSFLLWSLDET